MPEVIAMFVLALIDAESGARARSENLPAFRLPGRGVF